MRERVALKLEAPLKPGDGVVFDAGQPDQEEEGGRVYTSVERGSGAEGGMNARNLRIFFGHGELNFSRIHVGDKLWKTSDPELDRRLRQSFAEAKPAVQRPIALEVHGAAGQPLTLIARDEARPRGAGRVPPCRWRLPRNSR